MHGSENNLNLDSVFAGARNRTSIKCKQTYPVDGSDIPYLPAEEPLLETDVNVFQIVT